jgi:hypothetical protein
MVIVTAESRVAEIDFLPPPISRFDGSAEADDATAAGVAEFEGRLAVEVDVEVDEVRLVPLRKGGVLFSDRVEEVDCLARCEVAVDCMIAVVQLKQRW